MNMFIRIFDGWICDKFLKKAEQLKRVHRFHTRILPTRIKWDQVFIMNIGVHLF